MPTAASGRMMLRNRMFTMNRTAETIEMIAKQLQREQLRVHIRVARAGHRRPGSRSSGGTARASTDRALTTARRPRSTEMCARAPDCTPREPTFRADRAVEEVGGDRENEPQRSERTTTNRGPGRRTAARTCRSRCPCRTADRSRPKSTRFTHSRNVSHDAAAPTPAINPTKSDSAKPDPAEVGGNRLAVALELVERDRRSDTEIR